MKAILKKTPLYESFDFDPKETNIFDKNIESLKTMALIKKAIRDSVEISVENLPKKISSYDIQKNMSNILEVINPLRSLINSIDSSNDINLKLEFPAIETIQIWCNIISDTGSKSTFIDGSNPASPMWMGRFIHKIYLVVLHRFGLIEDMSKFTKMVEEETDILYSI